MTQHKITINDVAEAAGVSVTTVSLVLSGKGRISAATVARVNLAIAQSGFVPNRSAAMLRGGKSGVIGLIVRNLGHPFYADMTAGLSEALEKQGKLLFLTQSGEAGQHFDRCFDSLVAQGVDGIVIGGGADKSGNVVTLAREQNMPLVCAARASRLEEVDTVRPDNAHAARLATEYLIRQGHQHIAWIGGHGASLTRAERIGGYCATLLQYGLPFHPEWIIECGNSQREVADVINPLLQHTPHVTAILADNAAVALGCYFGLLRSGRQTGRGAIDSYYSQHIALVGFSDEPQAELTDPPLTVVTSTARDIGRAAAERIVQRIAYPLAERQNIIVSPQLLIRGSA